MVTNAVKIMLCMFVLMTASGIDVTAASADGKKATPGQAIEFQKKMVAYAKQAGCEKALSEFSDKSSNWNTTYINLWAGAGNMNGYCLANGKYPNMVGYNFMDVKDATGRPYIRSLVEKLRKDQQAQEQFIWMDTKSNSLQPRTMVDTLVDCGGKEKIGIWITYEGKI